MFGFLLPFNITVSLNQLTIAQRMMVSLINEAVTHLPKYTRREMVELGKSDEEIRAFMEAEKSRIEALQDKKKKHVTTQELDEEAIHVMVTSDGRHYMNWQTRIMYYTWNKVQIKERSEIE